MNLWYFPRVPAALRVELHHRDGLLGTFMTRDIGLDGLFLKTGSLPLRVHDGVRMRVGMCGEKFLLCGMVARRSEQGIGIRLGQMNRDLFRVIFDLFKERQSFLQTGRVPGVSPVESPQCSDSDRDGIAVSLMAGL